MTYVALDGYSIFITILNIVAIIGIGALVAYLVRKYHKKA